MSPDALAVLSASPTRRWFAIGVLWVLALMLIWLALAQPPAPGWQAFLIVLGALSAYGAETMRRATTLSIVLTEDGLSSSNGQILAPMDAIKRVDRGVFAFKPSNGFVVVLDRKVGGRSWAPGLWWRMGRRIGIGGVTSPNAGKAMAEIIALKLAQRDGQAPL